MARMSGAVGGANPSSLARLSVLPNRRLPHVVTALGDSRAAAIYIDSGQRGYAAISPVNWANALLGQRLVIGACFGKSGDRTDQMLPRLASAIGTGAGLLYIHAGLNDIAQNYPSAATSGATAFANIRTMIDAARAAGMIVVVEAEVGSNALSAAQVGQVNDLNAMLFDHAERAPGVHVHDARLVAMQPAYSDSAVQFRAAHAYDGTHLNGRGAAYWGESLAALLGAIVPMRPGAALNMRAALPGNGRRQLVANPLFVTANGGTAASGASGTIPAGFVGSAGTGASASYATQADPDGLGNNVTIDASFTAANAQVRLYQDVATANLLPGDLVEGVAVVDILGTPSGLASLYLQFTQNTGAGGQSLDNFCLYAPAAANYVGVDKAMRLTLRTRPHLIRANAGSGGYAQLSVRALSAGSGSCQFVVRQMALKRRDSDY